MIDRHTVASFASSLLLLAVLRNVVELSCRKQNLDKIRAKHHSLSHCTHRQSPAKFVMVSLDPRSRFATQHPPKHTYVIRAPFSKSCRTEPIVLF